MWSPYVEGDVDHDFSKTNHFDIADGLTVTDGDFNAELGAGIDVAFAGGARAGVGVSWFGVGSGGLSALNVQANLKVPLN